jgi:hypothetical protein
MSFYLWASVFFPKKEEPYAPSSQLKKSSASIPSILMLWKKIQRNHLVIFLDIFRGSLFEIETSYLLPINLLIKSTLYKEVLGQIWRRIKDD